MENNTHNIVDNFEVQLWNFEKVQKKDGSYSDKIFIAKGSFSTYKGEKDGKKQYVNIDVKLNFFREENSPYTKLDTELMVKKFNEKLGNKKIRVSGTMSLDFVSKTITDKDTNEKKEIWAKAITIAIATDEDGKYRVAPKGENNG